MPKKTTDQKIDDLALAVGRGFDEIHKKIDSVHKEMRDGFAAVDRRFEEVNHRLDKIEFAIAGHDGRINALEDRVRQLATKVGVTFN